MEQLESRALGKPKESVTVDSEESETERALRAHARAAAGALAPARFTRCERRSEH